MMLGLHSCDFHGRCGAVLSLELTISLLLRKTCLSPLRHAHDMEVPAGLTGMLPGLVCIPDISFHPFRWFFHLF